MNTIAIDYINFPICRVNIKELTFQGNEKFISIFSAQIQDVSSFHSILLDLIKQHSDNQQNEFGNFSLITTDNTQYITMQFISSKDADFYYFLFAPVSSMNNVLINIPYVQNLEKEYLTILEYLHDDFVILDKRGTVQIVLPNFETFYGIPAEQVIGRTCYELEEQKVFNPSVTAKALRSGMPETLLQLTGSGKYMMCTAIPIKDACGNIIKFVSYSRDVTHYELLKEEHEHLQEAIQHYSSRINDITRDQQVVANVIGNSKEIKNVVAMASRAAKFDINVLLTGESGVGKTMFANIIHSQSLRADKPFIEINCGAIPENLFESELFGYERGAFTGANTSGKIGWIEMANGGTLFLDEIADMPLLMQVKLLKTLDTKKICKIGSTHEKRVDFRLVSATNKDLERLVAQGLFREDLYYRLNLISVHIPSLREHKEDIFPLIMYYLNENQQKYGMTKSFSNKAINLLTDYSWPGNVRELKNAVERLFLTIDDYVISDMDLPSHLQPNSNRNYFDITKKTLPEILDDVEKTIILKAYEKHRNTIKMAAELGISQPSVSLKLKKYLPK